MTAHEGPEEHTVLPEPFHFALEADTVRVYQAHVAGCVDALGW